MNAKAAEDGDLDAKDILYLDLPMFFTWKSKERKGQKKEDH
jgi:hypothetical protein